MQDISTAMSNFEDVSGQEGLQYQNDATTLQKDTDGVTKEGSAENYSYFARYGYREVQRKEK